MRIKATIRKWTDRKWGIANAYPDQRFFVHFSNAASEEVQSALALGVKITFEAGAPRNEGDLPTALRIELAPTAVKQTGPTINDVVATVETVDGKGGAA